MRLANSAIILIALLTLFAGTLRATADINDPKYAGLFEPIQQQRLTSDDKRFLQLALAFENKYLGLLDGQWGAGSRKALSRYSYHQFDAAPVNIHLAALFLSAATRIADSGWDMIYLDTYGLSLLFPLDAYQRDADSGTFQNWSHTNSSLAIAAGRSDFAGAKAYHAYGLDKAAGYTPYTVRRERTWITSTRGGDGLLYVRSDYVNRGWTTIILSATPADQGILNAVAASLGTGRRDPIRFSRDGYLDHIVTLFLEIADEDTTPPQTGRDTPSIGTAKPETSHASSGTGFVVNDRGDVLTNAHVAGDCKHIMVDGTPAQMVAQSKVFDLAVINAPDKSGGAHARFASAPAQLNSDVLVAGFPLSDLLEGLNVTRGVVSSLKGVRGDSFNMQISAAVQAGNSGGPLLDSAGLIVGVVVAKLRQDFVQEATGSVPENVNFAVRGEIAKLFLAQNSVPITIGTPTTRPTPVELGAHASDITVFIECR
ncbi:S1C family serine protease [Roseovarius pelagicus]|uniref:Serine protease n=1 Tax=Roseovarius pelagicus TaxID=2980108 RepID=A0ABY6DFF0_9RHOB|nr:serine protease [Roseovarius pelagicus]UXX84848.1 serine protease [Roseovarius pelagicus]